MNSNRVMRFGCQLAIKGTTSLVTNKHVSPYDPDSYCIWYSSFKGETNFLKFNYLLNKTSKRIRKKQMYCNFVAYRTRPINSTNEDKDCNSKSPLEDYFC